MSVDGIDARYTVSVRECRAIQLLAKDGWNHGELALCFETTRETVRRHANNDCEHSQEENID